ncbi:MAG: hypothetical protein AB1424_12615 [Thermodesulfobacteriota bacterium]
MNQKWRRLFLSFLVDTKAAVSSEHAILLTLIALGIFAAVTLFGNTVYTKLYQTSMTVLPFGS